MSDSVFGVHIGLKAALMGRWIWVWQTVEWQVK